MIRFETLLDSKASLNIAFVCDGCGETITRSVTVTKVRATSSTEAEVSICIVDGEVPIMRRVGDKRYCEKHEIHVTHEIRVDGKVVDIGSKPWGSQ